MVATIAPPWPDCSVRRAIAADATAVAFAAVHLLAGAWQPSERECRASAAVRVGRRSVPVEVVVAPWSATATEVRIELRTLRLPHDYYDAAHAMVDDVRDALVAALGVGPARRYALPHR